MKELFWIAMPGDFPLPCLDSAPDGTPREPDNITYFDLESASRQSGMSTDSLRRAFKNYMAEQLAIANTPATEPEEVSAPGELKFVSNEEENRSTSPNFDDLLKGDLSKLDAEVVRERVRQRMAGIKTEHYVQFAAMAKESGYDILRRECYPVVQWNPETKRDEVFCCATLSIVEQKMHASGLCDGWVGPALFGGADGEMRTTLPAGEQPSSCQVTLRRKGYAEPKVVVLQWDEAAQYITDARGNKDRSRLTQYWRERPKSALLKCAKMVAMRDLFRDVVGIVYVREELAELSQRHRDALPEPSTTLAGMKWKQLASMGSTAHNPVPPAGTPGLELDIIDSEVDARVFLGNRGLPEPVINRLINAALRDHGDQEDADPESFWTSLVEKAARDFALRRRA